MCNTDTGSLQVLIFLWVIMKYIISFRSIYIYKIIIVSFFQNNSFLKDIPRTDGGRISAPPPEVFRRYRKNRGAQRREIWHDYSFINFTHDGHVLIS